MRPTSEQQEAIDAFRTGGSLKINAYAGTGKTTTLQQLAATTSARGMYLAFNKSIAQEAAEKFPASVNCSTVHSLAFRATPSAFKRNIKKMTDNMNVNAFADLLQYEDCLLAGTKVTARAQGHLARETLRHFMQGGLRKISNRHVPNLDHMGSLGRLPEHDQAALNQQAIEGAQWMWRKMSDPSDPTPLGHDGYLKLWALSDPRLAADFILLDEAQDTNPVVLGVLAKQQAQIVYVGDRHQQIYEWRGAVNAMDLMKTAHASYLTTSFRFGPKIAEAASAVLRRLNEARPLTGNPAAESFIGVDHPDAILARTNATVMSSTLEALTAGKRPHIVGGIGELIRMLNAVRDLKQGRPTDVAEFFGFTHWNEVVEFSKLPEGEQMRTFVSLVENFGEERLITELRKTADTEKEADLIISTAHKAKGREWDCVRLAGDFMQTLPPIKEEPEDPWPLDLQYDAKDYESSISAVDECADQAATTDEDKDDEKPSNAAELRLFYVALTRARKAIDIEPTTVEALGVEKGPDFSNPRYSHLPKVGANIARIFGSTGASQKAPSSVAPPPKKMVIPQPTPLATRRKAPPSRIQSRETSPRQKTRSDGTGGNTIVCIVVALAIAFFLFS